MAAPPPPAAVVPPPVAVTLPGGNATPDLALHLDANDPFVVHCGCLSWVFHAPVAGAAGAGTASIPHFVAIRAFFARLTIGDNPANRAAAAQYSPVNIALDPAAWSRILTELRDSDLFEYGPFDRMRDLDKAINDLMIQNPGNLVLAPADYLPGLETFDAPAIAAVAAGRGRGRGRAGGRGAPAVPAVPAVPGPPELKFLQMTSLDTFFTTVDVNPMLAFARLVGAFGPCGTRAVRMDMLSQVRTTASTLRPQVAKAGGFILSMNLLQQEDAVLASVLGKYTNAAYDSLTSTLALDVASAGGFQSEMRDAFLNLTGAESDQSAVLTRRLSFIDDRFSPPLAPPAHLDLTLCAPAASILSGARSCRHETTRR